MCAVPSGAHSVRPYSAWSPLDWQGVLTCSYHPVLPNLFCFLHKQDFISCIYLFPKYFNNGVCIIEIVPVFEKLRH